jgi:sugar diacid utilization regulator
MTSSYRETLTSELRHDERERTAMVEALLDGNLAGATSIWEVADLLRLPASASYVVIAAEVPDLAREALPGIEARLAKRGIASAWQLRPEVQLGVACFKTAARLGQLMAALGETAGGRVGLSPEYSSLEETARAVRLARIAMTAAPVGQAGVTAFDAVPLAIIAVSAADVLPRVSMAVLGALADVPTEDRAVLLETLEAWRDNHGSTASAAAKLYCHPNTVRHRLRRVEALTGRSLSDPRAVAELCLALEAVRLLPGVLEH